MPRIAACAAAVLVVVASLLAAGRTIAAPDATPVGVPAPANDLFAQARDLRSDLVLTNPPDAPTLGAGVEPGEPSLSDGPMQHSVWFRWTAPATHRMKLDGCLPDVTGAPRVGVFVGGALAALQAVGTPSSCYFDSTVTGHAVDFNALAGQTYYFAFDEATAADRADNLDSHIFLVPWSPAEGSTLGDGLQLVTPTRVVDTRTNGMRLAGGAKLDVAVTTALGISPAGVSAVAVNVTAVDPAAGGWFRAAKAGTAASLTTSTVNFGAGVNRANLAVVPVDAAGHIEVLNGSGGSADVIVDAVGYYSRNVFQGTIATDPVRLIDTRTAGAAGTDDLIVNVAPMPANTERSGVILQLTATEPAGSGYLTAYQGGQTLPPTSNVNFNAGETISNRVMVPVGTDGRVVIHRGGFSRLHVVVDQVGWVGTAARSVGALHAVAPARLLDSRLDGSALGSGSRVSIPVAGRAGVPSMQSATERPQAVLLNLTVTNTSAYSWLVAYSSRSQPPTSDLNWAGGEDRANLVLAPLAPDGTVTIYNSNGTTDLVIDVLGWTD